MPETSLTPSRRRAAPGPDSIAAPARAPFVELGLASCFSFLRGASDALDLVTTARALGYDAIGVADANSMAGVVRMHSEAKALKLRPVIGCRIETVEGLAFLAYPVDRAAYGRLCRLISAGRMATLEGEWQDKGVCEISLASLAEHAEGVQLVLVPPGDLAAQFTIAVVSNVVACNSRGGAETRRREGFVSRKERKGRKEVESAAGSFAACILASEREVGSGERLRRRRNPSASFAVSARNPFLLRVSAPPRESLLSAPFADLLPHLVGQLPTLRHIAASYLYTGDDVARISALDAMAKENGLAILATNDVLYHAPHRRPLHDVMTAIRHKTTVARAGHLLQPNAERYLKSPEEMQRLFVPWPHAIKAARDLADACRFSLDELRYEYPEETYPDGLSPQLYMERLTWEGAAERYPEGVPGSVRETLATEFAMIAKKDLARYFLTIKDIIDFSRNQQPPILCQGRGSAANSAVCYCLGITAVDPAKHQLLFDRFISEDRDEPPDIDVDFEHERREEVIQYIYQRYGRQHAGLCATVIHYRPRMAIREVGKAMGLSEDVTSVLARTVWGGMGREIDEQHVAETGLNVTEPHLRRVLALTGQLIGMPRHLSQHPGGFILTHGPLTETVPIGNGAMADRSFIEWDKDDIDALGILKIDILALGMLTCIRKSLDLLREHHGRDLTLATVPREDPLVYDMLCKGDSVGVFQVESRAQMNMLPRLRPRCFYDLVIEVAIVRPGPIQGDMVHPFLKRRRGAEKVEIPAPAPEHGPPDELTSILARTLGVPIFQEQAMKIALDAARFSSKEANRLRKAMATFRSRGMVHELEDMMVGRMIARGYDPDFATRCFNQIKGFGEYGFPESHAASFAHLVYVSSWLKCHFPAAFAAALLNSQPMGFYAPAQIVRDAREHGVVVLPADVNCSAWDCSLEESVSRALRQAQDERGAETRREERKDGSRKGAKAQRGSALGEAPLNLDGSANGNVRAVNSACGAEQPLCAFAPLRDSPFSSLRVSAPPREPQIALRLGLRQIDGLPEHAAARLIAAREEGGPFADVASLRERAGLSPATIERLAAADAFTSLALPRRQALWDARSLIAAPDLPLFAHARARDEGAERAATRLPQMPLSEEVVADYQTQRLSLKAHPLAFLRASLADRGFVRCADLRTRSFRSPVQVAGVVLIRQRPGSAKGVVFVTLEDETGVANIVVWPDMKERFRREVMGARLMEVRGRVERDDEVIHLIAAHIRDASADLALLSDDPLVPAMDRADHMGHPRNIRVIPKSRDFH